MAALKSPVHQPVPGDLYAGLSPKRVEVNPNDIPSPMALFDSPRGGTFAPIGRLSYNVKELH